LEGNQHLDAFPVRLKVPALVHRPGDVLPLADHFLSLARRRLIRPRLVLSDEAQGLFVRYRWPGNVRELKNVVTRAARAALRDEPWEQYVDWAVGQGLAPLAAYNLEYRLGGAGAPEWARDRLLSLYQGTLNDNVMKLVNFKRAVDDLEGRKLVLLGAASFAE